MALGLTPVIIHSSLTGEVCNTSSNSSIGTISHWNDVIYERIFYYQSAVAGLAVITFLLTLFGECNGMIPKAYKKASMYAVHSLLPLPPPPPSLILMSHNFIFVKINLLMTTLLILISSVLRGPSHSTQLIKDVGKRSQKKKHLQPTQATLPILKEWILPSLYSNFRSVLSMCVCCVLYSGTSDKGHIEITPELE